MIFETPYTQREGITLGTSLDICKDCRREGKAKPGDLEYKEVFKIDNFGEPICLCMEHFQKKLGKYILVDSSELSTDIEEEQTKEEVQAEDKEEDKKPAKKTTKKEATKNANGKATK